MPLASSLPLKYSWRRAWRKSYADDRRRTGARIATYLEQLLHLGDTSRTADKDNVVDGFLLDTGILENLFDGLHRLAEEIHVELLELGACERLAKVFAVEEALDLDADAHLVGQGAFGLFDFALELAHGARVGGDVFAVVLALPELHKVVDDSVIKVFASEVSVAGSRQDLKDTILDRQQRDIKGTTTKVVDDDLALCTCLVEPVGNGGRCRLVDDTSDVETGNDTSVFGRLALGVVEAVRWGA
jgi:hypothetical protein